MDPLQLLAAGVALAHACLLAGVYLSSSIRTNAFVSTELNSMQYFRAALTAVVTLEATLCACYIYNYQKQSKPNTTAAFAFVAAALAGWALLSSYQETSAEHLAGAAAFIASTAAYSLFFISKASAYRPALYALWALSVAASLAFAALYAAALYDPAADAEWAAFTLHAITLLLFFAGNPPEQKRAVVMASEAAVPLLFLHPSAFE